LIAGNIVLNFTAEKFKPEQLLYFSLFPVFIGITLALVMTLIWQNIITLIIGMAIYASAWASAMPHCIVLRYFPASMEKVRYRQ
jgi:hypothetical protein